jgi:hypothetical protein
VENLFRPYVCRLLARLPKQKGNTKQVTSQLMTWGVIPTAAAYAPTSAGGRKRGGQVEKLASMVRLTDKVQLKNKSTSSGN